MTNEELEQQKDVEFYAACVGNYYTSALEHDKSIFALAAGGIGLLLTLLTTIGTTSGVVLTLYALSAFSFLTCLLLLLKVFRKNNEHIEGVIMGTAPVVDPELTKLDNAVRASFAWGLAFAIMVGGFSAWNSYQDKLEEARTKREKEKVMANEKQSTTTRSIANESFNGVSNLTKSFNNVSSLRPQTAASTQSQAQVPASTSAPATQSTSNAASSTPSNRNGR